MPIYMDRHDVSDDVTAEHVAHLHSADLNVQHKFGCNALTYWFDEKRKTAFCLVEAPNKQAMSDMHAFAHGKMPNRIIEVDKAVVASFLGRIEDPKNEQDTALNIIIDPAFRAIMSLTINFQAFLHSNSFDSIINKVRREIISQITKKNGHLVRQDGIEFLASFSDVSKAVSCAIQIKSIDVGSPSLTCIGISGGVPVANQNGFFESAISAAQHMSGFGMHQIIVSSDVKELIKNSEENVFSLKRSDALFLDAVMTFMEANFADEHITSNDLHSAIAVSKSKFYRKLSGLLKKSPNSFLREYRLNKSISLLQHREETVSEIAFLVGFKSQSYFSKAFFKQFGSSPTEYRILLRS